MEAAGTASEQSDLGPIDAWWRLAFLGVERNAAAEPDCDVAAGGTRVRVLVVRAREELVLVGAARRLLAVAP